MPSAAVSQYAYNVLLSLDMLASAVLGGIPGETLSGRAGTAYAQGKLRGKIFAPIINWLARNPNHCAEAVQGDLRRAAAVIADDMRSA
jgi:hypothetical protein